jgi:hypothetical protein
MIAGAERYEPPLLPNNDTQDMVASNDRARKSLRTAKNPCDGDERLVQQNCSSRRSKAR